MTTLDEFFEGKQVSRQLFNTVRHTIDAIGPAQLQVTKSQIAFRRRKAFAWVWKPGKYLRGRTAPQQHPGGFHLFGSDDALMYNEEQ